VSLRTVEAAFGREVELGFSEIVLYSSSSSTSAPRIPSTLNFSIPLTSDTPQSLHTPRSSLSHVLTATLHPSEPGQPTLSKVVLVQPRRFISHTYVPVVHPETQVLQEPTLVELQIPRTTFVSGEIISLYVTIPSPSRELVVQKGLRLRNVRAELLRLIQVQQQVHDSDEHILSSGKNLYDGHPSASDRPSTALIENTSELVSSMSGQKASSLTASYATTIAHSGASCRFHTSKPVRLRFLLHQPVVGSTDSHTDTQSTESNHFQGGPDSILITQSTVLHSVTFQLNVHVSFIDISTSTEHISTISVPVVIVAPPAPLPEVDQDFDCAYQKKHDRPPARTVRYDEESSGPNHEEAGPSYLNFIPPPPFEERDAPPPFSTGINSSARLPTFLESEAEIIVPPIETVTEPVPFSIAGEGTQFGFSASEQFDGHSDDTEPPVPPTVPHLADVDLGVTDFTGPEQTEHAINNLSLILEHDDAVAVATDEHLPPPPPVMDDPSDPPPSIDSDFRSPRSLTQTSSPHGSASPLPSPAAPVGGAPSEGNAPPPYLHNDGTGDEYNVMRPPPYTDFVPAASI
jgi:hypothetical protein